MFAEALGERRQAGLHRGGGWREARLADLEVDEVVEGQVTRPETLGSLCDNIDVVFSSIGFLRIFDHVFNMTTNDPGGPLNATKPLVLMIYETAFTSFDMGYAAAQTVVLFLVLLVVSLLQLRILRDR